MSAPDATHREGDKPTLAQRLVADGLVVALIAGWALLAASLPEFILPGPLAVGERLLDLFTQPDLLAQVAQSAARVVASVAIATLIGAALAVLAHAVPLARKIVERRIQPILNSFPSVGWAILAVIWFEISDFSVIFVQVMILIPFCLINVAQGLRELDRELLEMAASFTRHRRRTASLIALPLLMPYLMAAVRIAYGVAWKIALISELFGADSGLGYLMQQAQIVSDAPMVFATCLAIVLIFIAGEKLVIDPLDRWVRR